MMDALDGSSPRRRCGLALLYRLSTAANDEEGKWLVDVEGAEAGCEPVVARLLYGPRLMPRFRSFRALSWQVSVRPYLTHREHGLPSSHLLHAF